jgi:Uma2 family endonuclease
LQYEGTQRVPLVRYPKETLSYEGHFLERAKPVFFPDPVRFESPGKLDQINESSDPSGGMGKPSPWLSIDVRGIVVTMTNVAATLPSPMPVPVTPSEEQWRAMTRAEREAFIIAVNEALSDPVITMSEGRPHKKAKSKAIDMLGLHFRAMGKQVYLAEELSVLYPKVSGFTPDIMAVLDVEEPEDDQRMAWVVQDEGKGLDWVLEVLWAGDRKKDLVENVEKYASLGIPEYFVYDQKQQRIVGYRLPAGGNRYQPILAQAGLYRSNVLGIDMAIVGNSLRFYQGAAELYDTKHLIDRLETMVANLQEQAETRERELEDAKHEADKATQEMQKSRAGLRKSIVKTLVLRKMNCSPENLARIDACTDPDVLNDWLDRVFEATSEADVFGGNG